MKKAWGVYLRCGGVTLHTRGVGGNVSLHGRIWNPPLRGTKASLV